MFSGKFTFLSCPPCPRIPHDTEMLWCLWLFGSRDVGGAHPVPLRSSATTNADAWISGDISSLTSICPLSVSCGDPVGFIRATGKVWFRSDARFKSLRKGKGARCIIVSASLLISCGLLCIVKCTCMPIRLKSGLQWCTLSKNGGMISVVVLVFPSPLLGEGTDPFTLTRLYFIALRQPNNMSAFALLFVYAIEWSPMVVTQCKHNMHLLYIPKACFRKVTL